MGRRGRMGKIGAFFDGFNEGYDTVGRVAEDIGLQRIASQTPDRIEEASGADQMSAAQAGLERAKAENPERATEIEAAYAPTIAGLQRISDKPAGAHYSMGEGGNFKQFDHEPSAGEQLAVKTNAMADVIAARDPLKATVLRHNAAVTERLNQQTRDEAAIRDAFSNRPGLQRMSPPPSAVEGNGIALEAQPGSGQPQPVSMAPPLAANDATQGRPTGIDRGQALAAEKALTASYARPSAEAYFQRKAPQIIDAYLRQGKVTEAKAFRDFVDSEEGRAYATDWSHGVRKLVMGDNEGAIASFERLYNNQLYPDGKTVKLTPTDGGNGYRIDFFGPDGQLMNSGLRSTADLAKQSAAALRPEKLVEFMATQQEARNKEQAAFDRQEYFEGRRDQRSQEAEDRRDARFQRGLDARAGSGGLTVPQQRSNDSILAARRQLTGMTQAEVLRRTQATTATGRENPDYSPELARAVKLAQSRMYGEDPAHDDFTANRARPASTGPAATRQPGEVQQRFTTDPAMKGMRMGRQTDRGTEVLDASGKLVGHYR